MRTHIVVAITSIILVCLSLPVSLLSSPGFTDYIGPENFANTPLHFVIFFVGSIGLVTSYVLLIRKPEHIQLNKPLLIAIVSIVGIFSIVSYPFVYDPLYYHIGAFASNLGTNPYLTDVTVYRNDLPISFTINHSYAYGPLWLLVTRVLETITTSQIGFIIICKLFGISIIFSGLWLYKTYAPWINTKYLFVLILLNPAVLLFGLSAGLIDIWVAFFALLCVLLIKNNKLLWAGLAISIATLIKPTAALLLLPLLAYSFNYNRYRSLLTFGIGLLPCALVGVFLLHNPLYLQGLETLKLIEQTSQYSFASMLATGQTILLHIPYEMTNTFTHFVLNIVAFAWVLYISILIIYRKVPFKVFVGYLSLTAILVPFLTGFIVKPWYIVPALLMVPLAESPKLQFTIAMAGVFLYISTLWFNMSIYFVPSEKFFWIYMGVFISFLFAPFFLIREAKRMH